MLQDMFGSVPLYIYWGLYILTCLASAYYVYQDARKQAHRALNIHPYWWIIFGLLLNIWAVLVYWLMQHSTLRGARDEDSAP